MEIGLGPDEFDCSGFVLRSLVDVCGTGTDAIDPDLRHCRQIWRDAQGEQRLFVPAHEAVGNLALFEYRWGDAPEDPGEARWVPAHIALVSAKLASGETRIIHSKSSEGRVLETPINRDRLLGFVAVRPSVLETARLALSPLMPAGGSGRHLMPAMSDRR